jgi:hypothetical protein
MLFLVYFGVELKEKVAYIIGLIIVVYAAFAGKDLTNMNELFEATGFLMLFTSVFIVFFYINARGKGDWHSKY